VRAKLAVLGLCLFACAKDGALDEGLRVDDAPLSDAEAAEAKMPESATPVDVATTDDGSGDEAAAIVDAGSGPRGVGEPCTSDAQCGATACILVHNGAHAATLCSKICNPFSPCEIGTTCYDDGTNRLCVEDCSDAGSACPPAQSCITTYAPAKGCVPSQ
jgi:hypothetical protein